ncbi:MAG: hypothetical protein L5657_10880, partial [Calditerricola sp.]|nr:hypothetical protein [Calditerricola sp.]
MEKYTPPPPPISNLLLFILVSSSRLIIYINCDNQLNNRNSALRLYYKNGRHTLVKYPGKLYTTDDRFHAGKGASPMRIGARIVKTALAVMFALYLGEWWV